MWEEKNADSGTCKRFRALLSPLQVAWPSSVSQTAVCLKVPSWTYVLFLISTCLSPKSGSAQSAIQLPLDWKEAFHPARKALVSQAACWTEKGVVSSCYRGCCCGCLSCPYRLHLLSHAWWGPCTGLEKREMESIPTFSEGPQQSGCSGLCKNQQQLPQRVLCNCHKPLCLGTLQTADTDRVVSCGLGKL